MNSLRDFGLAGAFALLCFTHIACSRTHSSAQEKATSDAPSSQDSPDTSSPAAVHSEQGEHTSDFSWPRLLGENSDGVGDCEGVNFDWTRRPEVSWRLSVGEGYGLGSVVGGRYYQFDSAYENFIASERLRAIDLATGKVIWSQQRPLRYADMYGYESGPRGTPAIEGDRIVTFGVAGDLCCRRLSDGKLIWSVDTNGEYSVVQNFFGVGSSPMILDGKVIVPVGGSPPEDQQIAPGALNRVSSNGSALVAFDLKTGKELWRGGDDLASYSSPRTMMLEDKLVVLYFARDHLIAVDPDNGEVLWTFAHGAELVESVNAMVPIVSGDKIFLSECYEIGSVLLRATKQEPSVVWQDDVNNRRVQSMRAHWSTPLLIDGFLYGCSGRNNPDSDFRCIEFATGKVAWSDGRRIRSSCTLAGDHVVVLEEKGRMQIVRPNPSKLDVVAEHDFSDLIAYPCWAAPIVVGNRILIRGDETVVCLQVPERE